MIPNDLAGGMDLRIVRSPNKRRMPSNLRLERTPRKLGRSAETFKPPSKKL